MLISPVGPAGNSASLLYSPALTSAQREAVGELVGALDPETATTEELAALRESLKSAGVRPSPELAELLMDAGFDPEALRTAGARVAPPPAPPEVVGQVLDALAEILEEGGAAAGDAAGSGEGPPSLRELLLQRLQRADALPGSILQLQA